MVAAVELWAPVMTETEAEVEWRAGAVPVSTRFDDPYYSLDDGMAESIHVFLDGNDLPARFTPGFHIAELGFGTGLNLAIALASWRDSGQSTPLRFTSFEAFPMSAPDMARALGVFGCEAALKDVLAGLQAGHRTIHLPDLHFELILGDARETIAGWDTRDVDAWFLDGFAPARNPELWEPGLLAEVARHTAPAGTAATYTAAGAVRRGLETAGFEVTRVPGYGRKRHMTCARKRP